MINAIAKATLLAQLFQLIVVVRGQSPCPTIFWYNRHPETNETNGYVQILSPTKGNPSQLNITFSHHIALSMYNVGIELAHTVEESIIALEQSMPLMFELSFPSDLPIPMLTSISFNSVIICTGPPADGPIVSTIAINSELHLSGKDGKKNLALVSVPPVISHKKLDNQHCGEMSMADPYVAGDSVQPGQWPWVVAIFIVERSYTFQCTGTLVTNRHVITAAHCFYSNDMFIPAENFVISIGRYHLRDWRETGSVNSDVAEYRIHPDYSYTHISSDADLAIAILSDKVEFSILIGPCCLWPWTTDLNFLQGKYGIVVGWGLNELEEFNSERKQFTAPIVSQEECLRSNGNFTAMISNRTFCVGHRNGSYACKGDNGSGLVIYERETGRYYLRGVVSQTFANAIPCEKNEFTVFVDVAKHLNWIHRQISQYYV